MDFVEACKKAIRIDTSPTNGTGDLCDFLKMLAVDLGFSVHIEADVQRGLHQANIICSSEPIEGDVHLMLQTHLDTVDPGSFALWEKTGRNPFGASMHNGKLFGLGSADTKLDFLCKLYAAKEFLKLPTQKPFAVVGTYGEEDAMRGADRLMRKKVLRPEVALVGEPTNFDVVYAGKGLANIEVTIPFSDEEVAYKDRHSSHETQSTQSKIFHGVAAHSSQPDSGKNALERLFRYLEQLPEKILILDVDGGTNHNTIPVQAVLEFDIQPLKTQTLGQKIRQIYAHLSDLKNEFSQTVDPRFSPSVTTLNIGMARTFNDHFKVMGCVRWPEAVSEEIYMAWMKKLQNQCRDLGAVFRVRDHKLPFVTNRDSAFSQSVLEAVQSHRPEAQMATQPVTNESSVFHQQGVECLVFGPGVREGNAHTPGEHVLIDDLRKAVEIYKEILKKLCFS